MIPLHTRGPEDIAEGVRRQALPLDRLLLGVGSPNPASLQRVRDGIAVLRGQFQTRLVVAALGPKMCRLAGEVADGVLFNWLTPEYARRAGEWVREGAKAAGRATPKLYGYVRVAMGPAAHDRLQQEGGRYAGIPRLRGPRAFILPEVKDESKWFKGKHRFVDPETRHSFVFQGHRGLYISTNTQQAKADEIKSWWDLINPEVERKNHRLRPDRRRGGPQCSLVPLYEQGPRSGIYQQAVRRYAIDFEP